MTKPPLMMIKSGEDEKSERNKSHEYVTDPINHSNGSIFVISTMILRMITKRLITTIVMVVIVNSVF